jgi:hypothetical protein
MEIGRAEVRHAIRGTLNALKLCVSAFDMPLETSEKLEFLSDIEASADKLDSLLDQYAALAPADESPAPPAPTSPDVVIPVAALKTGG